MKYVRIWDDETGQETLVPFGDVSPGSEGVGGLGGWNPAAVASQAVREHVRAFDWGRAYGSWFMVYVPWTGGVPPAAAAGLWLTVNTSEPERRNWIFTDPPDGTGAPAMVSGYLCDTPGLYHLDAMLRVRLSPPAADALTIRKVELMYAIRRHPDTMAFYPYLLFGTGYHILDTQYAPRSGNAPAYELTHLTGWGLAGGDLVPLFPGDVLVPFWRHYGVGAVDYVEEWDARFSVAKVGDVLNPSEIPCCDTP